MKEINVNYKKLWEAEQDRANTWFSHLNHVLDMWQVYINRVAELEKEVNQYKSKGAEQKPNFDGLSHSLCVTPVSIQSRVRYDGEVISLQKMTLDEAGLQKKRGKR